MAYLPVALNLENRKIVFIWLVCNGAPTQPALSPASNPQVEPVSLCPPSPSNSASFPLLDNAG